MTSNDDPDRREPPAGPPPGAGAESWMDWFDRQFGDADTTPANQPTAAEPERPVAPSGQHEADSSGASQPTAAPNSPTPQPRALIDTTPDPRQRSVMRSLPARPPSPPPPSPPSPPVRSAPPPPAPMPPQNNGAGDDGWGFLDEDTGPVPITVIHTDPPHAGTPSGGILIVPDPPSWPVRALRRVARRPWAWIRRPWPAQRIAQVLLTAFSLIVTTWVMSRVGRFNPFGWTGIGGRDLIFDETTPAGGDLGAHVWTPAFLRDHLLPNWQLSGWSMDWYAGLPVYRFYMVIPGIAILLLDTFLSYGVAIKVVAVSGLVTLPFCCWAFGRLARFRYPMPELFAFAGVCFALNESYYLLGGNVKSTMAGEFSFSIAISLMMLGLGLLCRALDHARLDGDHRAARRVLVWAAVLLALACLSHGIVLIYTLVTAMVIVMVRCGADLARMVRRRFNGSDDIVPRRQFFLRTKVAIAIGLLTLALSAFWVFPFLLNHQFMTDMKYQAEPSNMYDSFWPMIFDLKLPFDILVNTLAVIGIVLSVMRRQVYGIALGISCLIGVALVYLTRDSLPMIGLLWNPRVLPFVYLLRFILMMIGAVELISLVVAAFRNRPARAPMGAVSSGVTLLVGALAVLITFGWMFQVLPGAGFVTKDGDRTYAWGPFGAPSDETGDALGDSWTTYNFNGYERRPTYPEYYDLVQKMTEVGETNGCGRTLWERDQRDSVGNVRYGSSMALMLLPFWTDGCIQSSEGLYFEASGTTPYHFLAAAAMSADANSAVRQMRDVKNDAVAGVSYVQALGIRYVMLTRPEAIEAASAQPELVEIASSGPWKIFEVSDSAIVEPLTVEPVVVNGRTGDQRECWLEVGTSWMQQRDEWSAVPAADGPDTWQRIDVAIDPSRQIPATGQSTEGCGDPQFSPSRDVNIVTPVQAIEARPLPAVTVSNVVIEQQSVEFDVDQVGVPVLVRVSYFPNWEVSGADGPYRIAPNFMVVIPTDSNVKLTFERSTLDLVSTGITGVGIVAALAIQGVKLPFFPRLQAMAYRSGCHTTFHHRYHLVWAPKYRYKVLIGDVRLSVREIIRQVCDEMGVTIVNGALSRDHVHMFVEIPPHVSVSDFVRRAKGRSSRKIQQEFEHIRKRYWGQRFWQRGYFSTTSGNITDDIIMRYLDRHTHKQGFSPSP